MMYHCITKRENDLPSHSPSDVPSFIEFDGTLLADVMVYHNIPQVIMYHHLLNVMVN